MDRKAVATAAIGIVGNGFLVPTVLSMLNLSQGWVLVSSAVTILAIWRWGHQPRTTSFVTAAGVLLLALATVFYFRKPDAGSSQAQQAAVDPHGLCFIAFKVWHHDKKMAVTAHLQNRNKQMVLETLVGRDFSLDGFPIPTEEEVPESKPLYPEEGVSTVDSQVVSLGKDIPKGTVLKGRVYFLIRYGPTPNNTAVLKVKGRVSILVGGLTNGEDAAFWTPDPDSTPDCSGVKEIIGPDADLTLRPSLAAPPSASRPRPLHARERLL